MAARIGIITDKGHPVFRQVLATHREQFITHFRWHPGIHPVGHNEIEPAQIGWRVHQVKAVRRRFVSPNARQWLAL